MADTDKTTETPEQKLDNGYSKPTDTRTDSEVKLNTPGGDFEDLRAIGADNPDMPKDNTPAGKALGHSDGRAMTQAETSEVEEKKE